MSIKQFLVEDLDGSLIEVSFMEDNPKQIWLVMKSDIMAEWAKGVDTLESNGLWYKPDTFIDFAEYTDFSIRVFQEMARSFNELEWSTSTITQYSLFFDILKEADVVRYNEEGHPIFIDK